MLGESAPFSTTFPDHLVVNFRTFRQRIPAELVAFLMLSLVLLPKKRQLLRRKNHCCVRVIGSEILSDFMLGKNALLGTTF